MNILRTLFLYGFPIALAVALVLMAWASWTCWFYPERFDRFQRMTWSDLFIKLGLKRTKS